MSAFAILGVGSRNVASGRSGRIISWLGALGSGVSYSPERVKRKRGQRTLTANNSRREEQKFDSNKKVTYTWRVSGSVIVTIVESQIQSRNCPFKKASVVKHQISQNSLLFGRKRNLSLERVVLGVANVWDHPCVTPQTFLPLSK